MLTLLPVLGSPLSAFVAHLSLVGPNKRYKLCVIQGEAIPTLVQFTDAKATAAVTDVIEGVLKKLSPFSRAPNPRLYSLS